MYGASYAEIMDESPALAREREREAFDRAIELMKRAAGADATPEVRQEATSFLQRLWSLLIDDLANPENALPTQLRADLISIGLWNMSRADQILRGDAAGFEALIYVNTLVRDGLQ
ncbi:MULTISPECIES: flagellar biosynthesis regulator FlaF [unclassified Methylobacterium]|jgi:flagellar biosynthesis activator protein FlaF|uniref:flagellar biosynthesis regulator FlaF n=1 Tax=unclassified Methylobacterium TaxID=2615210 RepID=UPI00135481D4|nr:flagellar biosynthesis regulator FlaF [Methylobacterium sp. 2A]MWV25093.1 flagellar biosynthesis regulator FlaF [Methylobacterium sp. 2A]